MDRTGAASGRDLGRDSSASDVRTAVTFSPEVRRVLGCEPSLPAERVWDLFLDRFGDVILKTAIVAQRRRGPPDRRHDAAMDAYASVLERLRCDGFRRLAGFHGGGEDDLTRWLVVVSRRICTDVWRERYGRTRESTTDPQRSLRRRLVDELWETRPPDELPAGKRGDPEWTVRRREQRRVLEAAVDRLAPRDRLLLSLRFDDELSGRRIAEFMGFATPFHVYRRLRKVLASLKDHLEGQGIDGPDP